MGLVLTVHTSNLHAKKKGKFPLKNPFLGLETLDSSVLGDIRAYRGSPQSRKVTLVIRVNDLETRIPPFSCDTSDPLIN